METWKLSTIADAYRETKDFRFNNYIVNAHVKNLIGNINDKTLLEVGCGFGRYLEIFYKEHPKKIVGCDISVAQIEFCQKNITYGNIELHVLDFADSQASEILGTNEYDFIYSIFVIIYLETLDKLNTFIINSYKCLKKGGEILICSLDILSATSRPKVFDILKFPTKLLQGSEYEDGSPIEIGITDNCVVTSYQWNFDTIKSLMEEAGFKNVERRSLFLDEVALQAFTIEELNIIKDSNILLFIKAEK